MPIPRSAICWSSAPTMSAPAAPPSCGGWPHSSARPTWSTANAAGWPSRPPTCRRRWPSFPTTVVGDGARDGVLGLAAADDVEHLHAGRLAAPAAARLGDDALSDVVLLAALGRSGNREFGAAARAGASWPPCWKPPTWRRSRCASAGRYGPGAACARVSWTKASEPGSLRIWRQNWRRWSDCKFQRSTAENALELSGRDSGRLDQREVSGWSPGAWRPGVKKRARGLYLDAICR